MKEIKTILKNRLSLEVETKKSVMNSLSDEERVMMEEYVAKLQEIIDQVDAIEDGDANLEEINTRFKEIEEKMAGVAENITALQEYLNSNKTETEINDEEKMENNYLQSKQAYNDYGRTLKNSISAEDFRTKWNQKMVQNGITIAEDGSMMAYVPDMVKGKIQDAWDREAGILKRMKIVNFKNYVPRYNTADGDYAEGSRAAGWRPGCTKEEQVLELAAKNALPQMIYKLQSIDADLQYGDEDGLLMDYIIEELASRIIFEIKIAVLFGDGREAGCGKIDAIEPMGINTADAFRSVLTYDPDAEDLNMLVQLRKMVSKVKHFNGNEVTVVITPDMADQVAAIVSCDGRVGGYMSDEELAKALRATYVEIMDFPDWAEVEAIAYNDKGYVLDLPNEFNPTFTHQADLYKNTEVYRAELRVKGLIEGLKSVAVLVEGGE